MGNFWLMKAEPDSRIVKGKDVKFSVDDFEDCRTTAWEGVRNHEAKNIMRKQMKVGDQVLFYHSNCRNPGIAAIAEVSKEAYPDYTADDPKHPYYDQKSASRPADSEPTWWMVELRFLARLKHFVPLSLLRLLSSCNHIDELKQLDVGSENNHSNLIYMTAEDLAALKKMPLLNRGRLSVQPVNPEAWATVIKLAEQGGWSDTTTTKRNTNSKASKSSGQTKSTRLGKRRASDSRTSETQYPQSGAIDNDAHLNLRPRRSKRIKA